MKNDIQNIYSCLKSMSSEYSKLLMHWGFECQVAYQFSSLSTVAYKRVAYKKKECTRKDFDRSVGRPRMRNWTTLRFTINAAFVADPISLDMLVFKNVRPNEWWKWCWVTFNQNRCQCCDGQMLSSKPPLYERHS